MTAGFARVVLRPSPGQRAADLCRDLIAIAGSVGAVRSVGSNGFAVDDQTALLYLTHADPPADLAPDVPDAPDVPAPTDPTPPAPADTPPTAGEPANGDYSPPMPVSDPTSTTTEPGRQPAAAAARQQRRVPTRKAAMTRGAPDGE